MLYFLEKISCTIIGAAFALSGMRIIKDPLVYNPVGKNYLDFRGYNAPLGIVLIIAGAGIVWFSMRKNK